MSDAEPWREAYEAWWFDDETSIPRESGNLYSKLSRVAFAAGHLAATAHLSAEREDLREALRPFAEECARQEEHHQRGGLTLPNHETVSWCTPMGWLRRARKLVGGQ